MAKPRATGADARLIGITEATYGTAPADGYFLLPFKSIDLDKEAPLGDDPLLGQGRAAQGADYDRPLSHRQVRYSAGYPVGRVLGARAVGADHDGDQPLYTRLPPAAPRRPRHSGSATRSLATLSD